VSKGSVLKQIQGRIVLDSNAVIYDGLPFLELDTTWSTGLAVMGTAIIVTQAGACSVEAHLTHTVNTTPSMLAIDGATAVWSCGSQLGSKGTSAIVTFGFVYF
jgi:hypothetical protein